MHHICWCESHHNKCKALCKIKLFKIKMEHERKEKSCISSCDLNKINAINGMDLQKSSKALQVFGY